MRSLTDVEAAAIAERQVVDRQIIRLTAPPRSYKFTVGGSFPCLGSWDDAEKKDE